MTMGFMDQYESKLSLLDKRIDDTTVRIKELTEHISVLQANLSRLGTHQTRNDACSMNRYVCVGVCACVGVGDMCVSR